MNSMGLNDPQKLESRLLEYTERLRTLKEKRYLGDFEKTEQAHLEKVAARLARMIAAAKAAPLS